MLRILIKNIVRIIKLIVKDVVIITKSRVHIAQRRVVFSFSSFFFININVNLLLNCSIKSQQKERKKYFFVNLIF